MFKAPSIRFDGTTAHIECETSPIALEKVGKDGKVSAFIYDSKNGSWTATEVRLASGKMVKVSLWIGEPYDANSIPKETLKVRETSRAVCY